MINIDINQILVKSLFNPHFHCIHFCSCHINVTENYSEQMLRISYYNTCMDNIITEILHKESNIGPLYRTLSTSFRE